MNETELMLYRSGYTTDRSGTHLVKLEFPPKKVDPPIKTLTEEQQMWRNQIKELMKAENNFPPPETWY